MVKKKLEVSSDSVFDVYLENPKEGKKEVCSR